MTVTPAASSRNCPCIAPASTLARIARSDSKFFLYLAPVSKGHVPKAALTWDTDTSSNLTDQVGLSSLTTLTLKNQDSVLGEAGMLSALPQLSAEQSLHYQHQPCSGWHLHAQLRLHMPPQIRDAAFT